MMKKEERGLSIVRRLQKEGWRERWGSGDHIVFEREGRMITVPLGCMAVKEGTWRAIERLVGWI